MIALLYDIHGNLPALDAVLRDAEEAGVRRFVLGGDYALFGPWPSETLERLESLEAEWLRGNGERWSADPGSAPDDRVVQGAIRACRDLLGETRVARLAALPEQLVRDKIRYCHASPVSDVRSFMPQPAEDEEELLAGIAERRLVFGHTHLQFLRTSASGIELLNPGSVGMPLDGDTRAAYALVADDGQAEHRRVPYDSAATAAGLRERFDPEVAETVAQRIEKARFSP